MVKYLINLYKRKIQKKEIEVDISKFAKDVQHAANINFYKTMLNKFQEVALASGLSFENHHSFFKLSSCDDWLRMKLSVAILSARYSCLRPRDVKNSPEKIAQWVLEDIENGFADNYLLAFEEGLNNSNVYIHDLRLHDLCLDDYSIEEFALNLIKSINNN